MTRPNPATIVDDLLKESTPPGPSHIMDKHPELVAALVHFLDLKAANDDRVVGVSFTWFYDNKLKARFRGPSRERVRDYIRNVLKRDTDGRAL